MFGQAIQATVARFVPKDDYTICQPMLLGIVQGFNEELDSFVHYEAPQTNAANGVVLEADPNTKYTHQVGNEFQVRRSANPNLAAVTPVYWSCDT